MDVAVVVALYNGADWIRSALDSVVSQTHPPSELIVVDDGSTDGSPGIVTEEFPEARLVENSGVGGPCGARNYGAGCASADKVAFLDQDDLWHEDHLKLIAQTSQEFPQSGGVHSDVARFKSSESPDYAIDGRESHAYDPWDDFPYDGLGEAVGGVIRRDAFEQVDGWSPEVEGGAVHHLWLKLGLVGDFAVTGHRTSAKREHEQQFSEISRQSQTGSYFEEIIDASEDALRRRRQRGLDTERFIPRLEAQKALLDFLRAANKEDRSGMQAALRDFGEGVAGEPRTVIRGIWNYFWWHAKPAFEQRGMARSVADFIDFTRQWPESLHQPRAFLQEWSIRRASALELIRRHPGRYQSWSLFFRRGLRRLRSI
jgi:glycosyltransferase involved in cell wall biosynthesis